MSEEENKNAVQDGQSQEEAVNSEQTEVQAEAKPTAENKSFSDKVKAFTDSTKKKINALTKKQKQIGLAIIAAILIVIIGLSVGIPLGLRSAGVVNAAGWDKAIDATIAE
ncbi:MAG: hypothetical protein LBT20_04870, partial [Clostridiales bacterium]|nr:hypothetical protein [Clostridiales bacterium]